MQIYGNKRKCLHKKRDQLPEDWFGTPTWPPVLFWNTDMATVTSSENALWRVFATATTNSKKAIGLDWQKNNFAPASRFLVHFLAVFARLRHETF